MKRRALFTWTFVWWVVHLVRPQWAWGAHGAPAASQPATDLALLRALAGVVLPAGLGIDGLNAAVERFTVWRREYKAGAEMSAGYGVTEIRVLPADPSASYPEQLEDLERRAKERVGGSALHWGGTCNRFSEEDLRLKSLYGLNVDWPMEWRELERYYCEAERRLGVAGEPSPFTEDTRSEPYPMPPLPLTWNLRQLKVADFRRRATRGTARVRAYADVHPSAESRLTLDVSVRNRWGDPMPKIEQRLDADTEARGARTRAHIVSVFERLAAANNASIASVTDGRYLDHSAGGCRAGTDATTSVCDSYGRTHDHENLFVVGAPTLPTAGCTNGTLTFVALTLRSAQHIADTLSRGASGLQE